MLPFLVLTVLVGNRQEGEEEDDGHSDPFYEHEEGLKGDEDEGDNEGRSKTCSTPLWKVCDKT
jgi:hypothetical protein